MKRMRKCHAVVLAAALSPIFAAAEPPFRDFVAGVRNAYLLAPAEVAINAKVSWSHWSPDGRCLVALQVDETAAWTTVFAAVAAGRQAAAVPILKTSLVAWSKQSHKAFNAYQFDVEKIVVSQTEWIDGSAVALVNVSEETVTDDKTPAIRQTLLRVPMTGEPAQVLVREVNTPSSRLAIWVANAPGKGPSYVLQRSTTRPGSASPALIESSVTPILPDGKLGRPIKTPDGYVAGDMYYDSQGQPWVGLRASLDTPSSPGTRGAYALLDVRAGTLRIAENNQILAKAPEFADDPNATISLVTGSEKLTQAKTSAGIAPLWLASDKEGLHQYALICSDAKLGRLSPLRDAVSYVCQGALFVREIVTAPTALVQASIEEAERLHAVSQAKQCGLALMMLAADFEDTLPSVEDYSVAKLEPYMKNPGDLATFTYTFGGARLVDIMNPAETEIGYVKGKGGRAVVYADSHVTWVPD
jgi:hypothetical protein